MSARSARPALRRGFTLIELMLTLLVVGVLLAIAYPSFTDQIRKSRRADAISALMAVQQAQERWRANKTEYAPFSANPADGLAMPSQSASNYYSLAISERSPTGYKIVATANGGKSQTNDANCQTIWVRAQTGTLVYGSGNTADIAWNAANPDPGNCWAR